MQKKHSNFACIVKCLQSNKIISYGPVFYTENSIHKINFDAAAVKARYDKRRVG